MITHLIYKSQNLAMPRNYISLMDIAQNLIFITSYCIYLKLLMSLFQNNVAY